MHNNALSLILVCCWHVPFGIFFLTDIVFITHIFTIRYFLLFSNRMVLNERACMKYTHVQGSDVSYGGEIVGNVCLAAVHKHLQDDPKKRQQKKTKDVAAFAVKNRKILLIDLCP